MKTNLGKLTVLGEPQKVFHKSGYNLYLTVQCMCGSQPFTIPLRHLQRRKNLHCGCEPIIKSNRTNEHGMINSSTYYSWASMWSRCTDPKHRDYTDYGGSGITICPEWKDFKIFLKDMGERPDGCTLNRIHGAKIYHKLNCEWASYTVQAYDQKQKSSNTSGRTGVYWRKNRQRWVVKLWKEKKVYNGGSYKIFEEAVAARVKLEEELYGFTKQ